MNNKTTFAFASSKAGIRLSLWAVTLPALTITACSTLFPPVSRTASPQKPRARVDVEVLGKQKEPSGSPSNPIRVHLQFDVALIELPADGVDHVAKVWNHVDEMRIEPEHAALLARNGLRMGVASETSWPALNAIFSEKGAVGNRGNKVVQPGAPLWVALGAIADEESIFCYQADGRMIGETFRDGTKCLRVDYEVLPGEESNVVLRLTPEIHQEREAPTWKVDPEDYQLSQDTERRIYSGLSAEWVVPPGHFLVIGPVESARHSRRLGDSFLTRTAGEQRKDVILCITPRPFRVEFGK